MKTSEDMENAYALLRQRHADLMQQKLQANNLADCQDLLSEMSALASLSIQELHKVVDMVRRHEKCDPLTVLKKWRSELPWA